MRRRGVAEDRLQSGDRVALLLGNRIEFVLAMFGAAHLGLGRCCSAPVSKNGDRICAVRLRCQAPDPRGQLSTVCPMPAMFPS